VLARRRSAAACDMAPRQRTLAGPLLRVSRQSPFERIINKNVNHFTLLYFTAFPLHPPFTSAIRIDAVRRDTERAEWATRLLECIRCGLRLKCLLMGNGVADGDVPVQSDARSTEVELHLKTNTLGMELAVEDGGVYKRVTV
jgi:hypothetical protein